MICRYYRNAKVIASVMTIGTYLSNNTQSYKKKQFDEANNEDELQSPKESFRIEYFIVVVFDMKIASLESRFEQLKTFEKYFLFTV